MQPIWYLHLYYKFTWPCYPFYISWVYCQQQDLSYPWQGNTTAVHQQRRVKGCHAMMTTNTGVSLATPLGVWHARLHCADKRGLRTSIETWPWELRTSIEIWPWGPTISIETWSWGLRTENFIETWPWGLRTSIETWPWGLTFRATIYMCMSATCLQVLRTTPL